MPTYADSAIDYNWEITQFNAGTGLMTVRYDVADSADADRTSQYQRFNVASTDFDSASIISLIENRALAVVTAWDIGIEKEAAADSSSISAPGLIGLTGSDRYKPETFETIPVPITDYNPLTKTVTEGDSETADAIIKTYTITNLDSDGKVAARNRTAINVQDLLETVKSNEDALEALGFRTTTGSHIRAQTSFDASAGGSFNYTNDKFDDYGVDSVSRTGTGEFVVTFSDPMPNANFTVITGVGDQDYSGAGASPRQVAIIDRDSNSVTVLCERTDDAVNDDNGYISIAVLGSYGDATETATFGEITLENLELIGQNRLLQFTDNAVTRVKDALGYTDSQMAQYIVDNGGQY